MNVSTEQRKNIESYNMAINDGEYELEDVHCNLCGSMNKKILFENDRYGINQYTVVCRKCGLVYSSPRLTAESARKFYESDEYRRIYDKNSLTHIFEMKYKKAINYTCKSFKPDNYRDLMFIDFLRESNILYDTVCEIGAAGGHNLVPFKKMGKGVTGVEYSKKLVQLGQAKGINMLQGSIENIDKPYDLVILIHVLEHFHNPVQQIKKLKEYINKYLFIEVPGIVKSVPSLQNAHLYYFSTNTLFRCVSESGFKIVTYQTINSNDFIMALFEKGNNQLYYYDFPKEVRRTLYIVNRFKINNFIRNIVRKLPFGDKILNRVIRILKAKKYNKQ